MQDYSEDLFYSINQSKETGGKVRVYMSHNRHPFNREIIYPNVKSCKDSLENDIAIFISDAKELFPAPKKSEEQPVQSVKGCVF